MKAFRGKPSIFNSTQPDDRRAELEVTDLSLSFGGLLAIIQFNLALTTGELLAIIGPNGAGKTSLLNCITGYYRAQKGKILFNGENISRLPPHDITNRGIGRTFQNIELFPRMTVLSNLLLARHIHCRYNLGLASLFWPSIRKEEVHHRRVVEELVDFLEMQPIRKEPVGSLPYGLRKRVELGRALALNPKLLVLDEPFAGMTLEEKEDMVRFLLELNEAWGQTMILVEHDMSVVMSISKRIIVLDFGSKIAEGNPEFIQHHPEVIKAYLGDSGTA
ncbi:MAG: ATP-binding cassette domain-containing protein [Proteobacteria bacterium]|nr:ATP-binding cassette domain-containing protein [Pseudomonadota bacterium]